MSVNGVYECNMWTRLRYSRTIDVLCFCLGDRNIRSKELVGCSDRGVSVGGSQWACTHTRLSFQ